MLVSDLSVGRCKCVLSCGWKRSKGHTLSPIIMEVENYPKWKETTIGGTHFSLNHDCGRKGISLALHFSNRKQFGDTAWHWCWNKQSHLWLEARWTRLMIDFLLCFIELIWHVWIVHGQVTISVRKKQSAPKRTAVIWKKSNQIKKTELPLHKLAVCTSKLVVGRLWEGLIFSGYVSFMDCVCISNFLGFQRWFPN